MSQFTVQQALARAIEHHNARQFGPAEALYRQILEHHPDHADALHLLGVLAHQHNENQKARALILQALALAPDQPIFHCNLGEVYRALRKPELAAEEYRRAIALDPKYANAYSNLSIALHDLMQFEESQEVCRKAIALEPRFAKAYNNLGIALQHSGRHAEAQEAYETALSYDPEFADAHRNYSLLLLLMGDLERGLKEYEWRVKCNEFTHPVRLYPQPHWQGEDLAGKTILLHTEQGFGDAIQFVRYVPMLANRGARVLLECQPSLMKLFESVPEFTAIYPYDAALPEFDYQLPLLSLPYRFHTTLESIPNAVPYLAAPPERVAAMGALLAQQAAIKSHHFKIGVAWAGSPTHRDDQNRSIALATFAPLFQIPDVAWVSLQQGAGLAQLTGANLPLVNLSANIRDFADTAALMTHLDLVISADTSVAHLAGALAKPIWTLIPCTTDWRWMRERLDTPWYPTMRLFRQPSLRNWPPVIDRVAGALKQHLAQR